MALRCTSLEKRPVLLVRRKLINFVWVRFERIQSPSFMHARSALGSPPPKTKASVFSVVAEFVIFAISKWVTDCLNEIFHSVLS